MALVVNDRVKETSTTTGTGTFNLAGAVSGFETFVAGIGNSNTTYYAIVNSNGEFEVGLGTVTDASPDTLARTTIISSSNSDSAVNFSAGTKNVFVTLPASKAVILDASGNVTLGADLSVGDDLTILGGVVDFKSNSGSPAALKMYCEVSNAHFQTLSPQPHSAAAANTLLLPDSGDSGTQDLVAVDISQTLTNKTLTSAVLNSTISGTSIKDEDNMASNSATHLATQQSIKAYVDTEVAAVPVGDITNVIAGTNLSGGGTSGDVTLNLADASTSAKGAASFSSDNFAASSGAITIKDLGVATGEIQDDAITLGKMAPGTDGNLISYDASGNPVAIATGSSGQVLTSAGAGAEPSFQTPTVGDITSVVAGAGLTGGATSGAATLNVVGGTGITANADDIAIDSTVTTLSGTQTLTNKTLTNPILTPTTTTAGKVEFLEGTNNGTNKLTLLGPAATADVTLNLPASDDTLVGKATTDTLTNKSIDASQLTGTVANARLDQQLQDVAGLAVTNGNFVVGDGSNFVAESGATVRTSLGLGTAAVLDTGISNTNVAKFTTGVADNDFLRVDGTAIEGRSAAQVLSDIGGQASLTFGISNDNAVEIDSSSVADDEYARFTANGLESRSTAEVLSDIGGITASSTDTLTNKSIVATQLTGTVANARLDAQLQDVAGLAVTNGGFIVGDGSNFVLETGATARTSIGLGTASNVEFEDTQVDSFGVGTAASGTTGEIRATNDVTAFYSSDESLKENIKNIENPLEKISKINGVTFDWTDDYIKNHGGEDKYFLRKNDVGVIAQEIEKVLPQVVATREDGIKAVKYDRIVALLIESIKELKKEIEELKTGA